MIITYKARVTDNAISFKDGKTVVYNDTSVVTANGTGHVKVEISVCG